MLEITKTRGKAPLAPHARCFRTPVGAHLVPKGSEFTVFCFRSLTRSKWTPKSLFSNSALGRKSSIPSPKRWSERALFRSVLQFSGSLAHEKKVNSSEHTWPLRTRCFSFLFSHGKRGNAQKFIQYLRHTYAQWVESLPVLILTHVLLEPCVRASKGCCTVVQEACIVKNMFFWKSVLWTF